MLFTWKLEILILLNVVLNGFTKPGVPTSGPFRSYVRSVTKCKKPAYPAHPNPTIIVTLELYNSSKFSSLRGSFDVKNYTTGVKLKTKSSIWENGKWKTNYILVDKGCNGPILPLLLSIFNIKYDREKCAYLKSQASFNIENTNKIHHIVAKTAEYGRLLYANEMYTVGKKPRSVYCFEFEAVVEPI